MLPAEIGRSHALTRKPDTDHAVVGKEVFRTAFQERFAARIYPEMGAALRKIMPKNYILVPGYGAQGGKGKDLAPFFNEDGLGAIVNSSRGIICAYQKDPYKEKFSPVDYADASRQAVLDMKEDLKNAFVK